MSLVRVANGGGKLTVHNVWTHDDLLKIGFTTAEIHAFEVVSEAANKVLALPDLHPMDRDEYCHAFHVIQNKLLSRPGVKVVRGIK